MLIGACIGVVLTTLILSNTRNGRVKAEYEQYIAELELEHQQALVAAQKRSVNTSRAVLKGKMAEQLAPIMPEFQYLPSDAIKYSFANLHHVYLSDDLDDIKIYPAGTP